MRIAFGECALDTDRRVLERGGQPVHLSPRAFAVLQLLVEERPRAVSKQTLLDRIWSDVVVEEQNVKNTVVEIRNALGADRRAVRTVQRFGYAFASTSPDGDEPRAGTFRLLSSQKTYALAEGGNVIGRAMDCAVVLTSTGVSRRHAAISVLDGRAVLADLGSKNGTWLNEALIREPIELHHGDVIRLGVVALVFRSASEEGETTTLA